MFFSHKNCLVTVIIKSDRIHSDVDGASAIASPFFLRLFAPEPFALRHDQILVGLGTPGVEVLVGVVAQSFVRNLDIFGLDSAERLVLHLLGRTVAIWSAAVDFREFSFFSDFRFCLFFVVVVAAARVGSLGDFLSTFGLQPFRGRWLRSRLGEISLLFVL